MKNHSIGSPQEWNLMLFKLAEFKAELMLDFERSFQDFKWLWQTFFCFYVQEQRGRAAAGKVDSIFNPELTSR